MNLESLQQQGWHIYDEVIIKKSLGLTDLHSIGIKIHKNENESVELMECYIAGGYNNYHYKEQEFGTFEDAIEFAERKLNNE